MRWAGDTNQGRKRSTRIEQSKECGPREQSRGTQVTGNDVGDEDPKSDMAGHGLGSDQETKIREQPKEYTSGTDVKDTDHGNKLGTGTAEELREHGLGMTHGQRSWENGLGSDVGNGDQATMKRTETGSNVEGRDRAAKWGTGINGGRESSSNTGFE